MKKTVSTVTIERSEYENLNMELKELKVLVEYYKHQLLLLKRRQFGSSSEILDEKSGQLNLFGNDEEAVSTPNEMEEISYTRKKRKGKREEDLSGLPLERIDYELSEAERTCAECGDVMRDIGVQTRRELKLIPAKGVVLEHTAPHLRLPKLRENRNGGSHRKGEGTIPTHQRLIGVAISCCAYRRTKISEWNAAVSAGKRLPVR